MDVVISDVEHRFGVRQKQAVNISWVLPSNLCTSETSFEDKWNQVAVALENYIDLFSDSKMVIKAELLIWKEKWLQIEPEKRPKTALSALNKCSSTFPNISLLLQLLATLPITTAEVEQFFF